MDITMIGLQNAGKTSLLRVLAVGSLLLLPPRLIYEGRFESGCNPLDLWRVWEFEEYLLMLFNRVESSR